MAEHEKSVPPKAESTYTLSAPEAIHDATRHAIREHGDQARTEEIDWGPVALTVGIRNLYVRASNNHVFVVPGTWAEKVEPKQAAEK